MEEKNFIKTLAFSFYPFYNYICPLQGNVHSKRRDLDEARFTSV